MPSHGPGYAGAGVEPTVGHDMLKNWSGQISSIRSGL